MTWCDQIVHPKTIARLADLTSSREQAAMVMPTVTQRPPYIHLERDGSGRIVRVLHRREGDVMPETGESDMGLFALSAQSYLDRLPEYARNVEIGSATGERNFLPFIPWIARTETAMTFPAESQMEAVGINTPQDLALVEQYLRSLSLSPEPGHADPLDRHSYHNEERFIGTLLERDRRRRSNRPRCRQTDHRG